MKKSNLKTGMLCLLRNGDIALVLKDHVMGSYVQRSEFAFVTKSGWLTEYEEDLTNIHKEFDIMEVYKPEAYQLIRCVFDNKTAGLLLWERVKKMTLKEIEKELEYEVEIIEG